MYCAAKRFLNSFQHNSQEDKQLIASIENIVGKKPVHLSLYKLAMMHSSVAATNARGHKESNERLEYLGDAILGACVADFLFGKYPFKDEGFLTEIRSRIVNRESLNNLGKKVGLVNVVNFDQQQSDNLSFKSLYGDALEALIGAVYLDRGFKFCQHFILKKLLLPHFNLQEIVDAEVNFKSKLIEWSQKENKLVNFDLVHTKTEGRHKEFTIEVTLDGQSTGIGYGKSKKKAEQDAARKTLAELGITNNE